jgi:hypothetical protein
VPTLESSSSTRSVASSDCNRACATQPSRSALNAPYAYTGERGPTVWQSVEVEWINTFDLAEDGDEVNQRRKATLKSRLQPEPAIFDSPAWWHGIEQGDLESHWDEGVINRPLWTGMNDFPEVEVVEPDGGISLWVRFGDVTQYSKGRGIRIRWVWQRSMEQVAGLDGMKVVLEVWLEAGAWRPTAPYGPGPDRSLDEGWEGGPAN